MAAGSVFEDTFTIDQLNPEGKKFDLVTRIAATGQAYDMSLLLDVNSDVYPLKTGEVVTMSLATSVDDGTYDPTAADELIRRWDYAMYGRVFEFDFGRDDNVTLYASFGGLLMSLSGNQRYLLDIQVGQRIYCLMRKAAAEA